MPTLELTLEAKVDGVLKAIEGVGRKIDAIDKDKTTWQPIDAAQAAKDAAKVVQTTQAAHQKIVQTTQQTQQKLNIITGQRPGVPGAPLGSIGWNQPWPPAGAGGGQTFVPAGAGSGGGGGGGGGAGGSSPIRYKVRQRYTYAPEYSDIGHSFVSGVGGSFSHIAGYAQRGATAGAADGGGLSGGALGLLRGGLIGAGVLGALKIGQGVSEGYDMAGERAHTLDTLKRQMGDVGVSFDRLKIASEAAATGLAMNSKDFAVIESTLNVASGRAMEGNPMDLAAAANTTTGFARAYGMDPNQTASLFGAARNVDPKRSYMEFAGILAQTIERTGKSGSAAEVTQAVLSFAATASRLSLSQANLSGFAGAYAGMTTMGLPGLTSEASEGILSQANAAASNMGAAGEAGQAFTLAAFNRRGPHLNPLEAMAEASGGLFASRASTYAQGGVMDRLYNDQGATARRLGGRYTDAAGKVHEGDTRTNFDMIKEQAERTAGGRGPQAKELQAEMLQRYFGLSSIQQAAALTEMKPAEMKNFDSVLKSAGVEAKDFNATNIQTVAKIAGSTTAGQLDDVYADLKTRTGTSALSKTDSDKIEVAKKSGDFGAYQKALVQATATKDYAQDSYTVQQTIAAKLDDLKTILGDTMLTKITDFEQSMIALGGGQEKVNAARKVDAEYRGTTAWSALQTEWRAGDKALDDKTKYVDGRAYPTALQRTEKSEYDQHMLQKSRELAVNTENEKRALRGEAPVQLTVNVQVDKSGNVSVKTAQAPTTTAQPRAGGRGPRGAPHETTPPPGVAPVMQQHANDNR